MSIAAKHIRERRMRVKVSGGTTTTIMLMQNEK